MQQLKKRFVKNVGSIIKKSILSLESYINIVQDNVPNDENLSRSRLKFLYPQLTAELFNHVPPQKKAVNSELKFFYAVENAFKITGRGTVVVGKVLSGEVKVGDSVDIILKNGKTLSSTIICIEMFQRVLNSAMLGDNVGIELRGVKKEEMLSARVIVNVGADVLHNIVIVKLHVLRDEEGGNNMPIFNYYKPYYNFQTGETRGLTIFHKDAPEMYVPGSDVVLKVDLDEPVPLIEGMPFIVHEGNGDVSCRGSVIKIVY